MSLDSSRATRLVSLELENIRCFEHIELEAERPWTVLLGDNGTGKTTILRSIALALSSPKDAGVMFEATRSTWIRKGAETGSIKVRIRGPEGLREREVVVRRAGFGEVIEDRWQDAESYLANAFIAAYGSTRGAFSTKSSRTTYTVRDATSTLFDPDAHLQDPELALRRCVDGGRSKDELLQLLDRLLQLPLGSTQLTGDGLQVAGTWKDAVPLAGLSDGYRTTLAWILDMLGWSMQLRPITLGGGPEDATLRGIVLIDEIEQHLHPSWQRRVIKQLRQQFPELQFAVTSHAPLCAVGTTDLTDDEVSLCLVRAAGQVAEIVPNIPPPRGQRADQILTSFLFGLDTSGDSETQAQIGELSKLLGMREPDEAAKRRIEELQATLQQRLGSKETRLSSIVAQKIRETESEEISRLWQAASFEARRQLLAIEVEPGPEQAPRDDAQSKTQARDTAGRANFETELARFEEELAASEEARQIAESKLREARSTIDRDRSHPKGRELPESNVYEPGRPLRSTEPLPPIPWFLGLEVFSRLRGIILDSVQHDFNLRDWMDPRAPIDMRDRDEVWFDYLADIGDGGLAMASVAYHIQHPVEVDYGKLPIEIPTLPRGEFLFIGGDYAYPASDVRTLRARVYAPFQRAIDAASKNGLPAQGSRPVFGIPANHDYYDDLIGFNRVMREPCAPDHKHTSPTVPGHVRLQSASYVRLLLPHDWELWGLDLGTNGIDFRQAAYFRPRGERRPKRLIVVTQKPPIVLDEDHTDDAHRESLGLLRLSSDFEKLVEDPTPELGDHLECRLDLSGDVHHYARYGNKTAGDGIPAHQFAGIVSGGGGAFLHPTGEAGTFEAKAKYPQPRECIRLLAPKLLTFWNMVVSGHAWLIAGLVALAIFAGWDALNGLPPLVHPAMADFANPAHFDWPNVAMVLAVLVSIGGPVLWFVLARPRLLGKRGAKRNITPPRPESFRTDDEWFSKTYSKAPIRDLLERSPFAGFVWVTAQIAIVFGLAIVPPLLVSHCVPGATAARVLGIFGVVFFGAGGILLAVFGSGGPKLAMALVGIVHAAIQLTLPIAILLYASVTGIAIAIGIYAVAALLAIGVSKTQWPTRVLRLVVFGIWIAAWAGTLRALMYFALGPIEPSLTVASAALAVLVGVIVCIHQFGWYLFVAFLFGGHNNEAGAAIRCQDYKQWVRFHLGKDGVLTGYVIGIDRAVDPVREVPQARVIDVFQVKPRSG